METGSLFSIPIFRYNIKIDIEKSLDIISSLEWDKHNPLCSEDKNIFSHTFVSIRENISPFVSYVMGEMGFAGVDYIFSRSWVTKALPNEFSRPHRHVNSFLSGVVYFSDDTSPIVFTNPYNIPFSHNQSQFTGFTSRVKPRSGDILIFPSNVIHEISENKTNHVRYSLAFNILPCGNYGHGDSEVTFLGVGA